MIVVGLTGLVGSIYFCKAQAGGREGQPRTIFVNVSESPRGRIHECEPQTKRFVRYMVGDEIVLATDNGRGQRDEILATYEVVKVAFPKSMGEGDRGACYLPHSRAEAVVYVREVE